VIAGGNMSRQRKQRYCFQSNPFQRGHANLSANAAVNMSLLLKTASMCVILNIAEEKRIRPVRKE
jgi:hypothetical protein